MWEFSRLDTERGANQMKRKRKMTLLPAVSLAALSALIAIPALSQSRLYAAAPEHFTSTTVVRGESLWTIADRYTAAGENVQDTVDNIMSANALSSATVVPGQHLNIPR
jgi:Trk-type K+ transport system membrane component